MARLLVVDDDQDVRWLLHIKFGCEHEVVTKSNGIEALSEIRHFTPDLVVLDVKMPGLTGLEVTRAVRADPVTSGIPIILLSASASRMDEHSGYAAGADLYITKPFILADLALRVELLLLEASDERTA